MGPICAGKRSSRRPCESRDRTRKAALRRVGHACQGSVKVGIADAHAASSTSYALLEENQKDKLTGRLPPQDNRRRAVSPGGERFWLAVADINHFKHISDTFGHFYGDEVLLLMAQIMKRTFRCDDLIFRFGGEEFVLVVPAPDMEGARVAFDKFRHVVAAFLFAQIDKVTISLGATEMAQCHIPSALIGRADEALYQAKHNGRDKLFVYEEIAASGEMTSAPRQGSVELF